MPHFKAGKELRERVDLVGNDQGDDSSNGSSDPLQSVMDMHAMH
ncbi:hypothetical protein AZ24_3490 [Bordetella bronchiseptica E013]|nr:hypothetical protein AZ24_3490 [Bordetella bronchiseptica E013]